MSKYPTCPISGIVRGVLAASIVIAQTDLKTKKVESPEEEEEKNIATGLMLYSDLCRSTYNSSLIDFIIPFLLTGRVADETDRNVLCFFLCIVEMVGVADTRDGHYNPKQASILFGRHKNITKNTVDTISVECVKKQVKEDLCDQAYHFMQCMMKEYLHRYGPPELNTIEPITPTTPNTTKLSFIDYRGDER